MFLKWNKNKCFKIHKSSSKFIFGFYDILYHNNKKLILRVPTVFMMTNWKIIFSTVANGYNLKT